MCNCKNCFLKIAETINIHNIRYDGDNIPNASLFIPGINECDKTLLVKIEGKFCKGIRLTLKLVGYKDENYNITKIRPIGTHKKLKKSTGCIHFKLTNKFIPLPNHMVYLPTLFGEIVDLPRLQFGEALEYLFMLKMKCCECESKYKIPLSARYLSSEFTGDVKCEKVDLVDVQDETHPIKVIYNGMMKYAAIPHCVTHGQAPRPIIVYYII